MTPPTVTARVAEIVSRGPSLSGTGNKWQAFPRICWRAADSGAENAKSGRSDFGVGRCVRGMSRRLHSLLKLKARNVPRVGGMQAESCLSPRIFFTSHTVAAENTTKTEKTVSGWRQPRASKHGECALGDMREQPQATMQQPCTYRTACESNRRQPCSNHAANRSAATTASRMHTCTYGCRRAIG
jgi:hypothetical protein